MAVVDEGEGTVTAGATIEQVRAAFAGLPRMTAVEAQELQDDLALIRGDDRALKSHLTALAADLARGRDPREVSAELRDLIEEI